MCFALPALLPRLLLLWRLRRSLLAVVAVTLIRSVAVVVVGIRTGVAALPSSLAISGTRFAGVEIAVAV